jgi:chemotaxis protein methyltransferase CheR
MKLLAPPLSDFLIEKFCKFVMSTMGLRFSKDSYKDLARKLNVISRELGFKKNRECLEWLLNTPFDQEKMDILARTFTIGETYFFRDTHTFQILRENILPDLIQRRHQSQRLFIWSAGCSTGEEAYSLAILLYQLIPHIDAWSIRIFGTDINRQFLHHAKLGHYKQWSFRSTPQEIKDTYFIRQDRVFTLLPNIKKMVTFDYYNLIDSEDPPFVSPQQPIDLIICNNVLIYLTGPSIKQVVNKFARTLAEGGWLSVTPIETPYISDPLLIPTKLEKLFFFKKMSQYQPVPPTPPTTVQQIEAPPLVLHETVLPTAVSQLPLRISYQEVLATYLKGDYAETIRLLEQSEQQGYSLRDEEGYLLIKAYLKQKRFIQAYHWCEKKLTQRKLDPILYYLKGKTLQELYRLAEARETFKRALFLEPNLVVAHFALGNLLQVHQEYHKAQRHFQTVFSLLQEVPHNAPLPGEEQDLSSGDLLDLTRSLLSSCKGDATHA